METAAICQSREPTIPGELWRDVEGYEGLYEVSNLGRMRRSYVTRPSRIVGGYVSKGYRIVTLGKANRIKTRKISVLVALAFIGPRPPGAEVCHIDGSRDNDQVENLMFGSAKENAAHRTLHGTQQIGEKNSRARLTEDDVRQIRRQYVKFSRTDGSRALAVRYGIGDAAIRQVLARLTWAHVV